MVLWPKALVEDPIGLSLLLIQCGGVHAPGKNNTEYARQEETTTRYHERKRKV